MGTPKAPEAPDFAKQYQQGINVYMNALPGMLQQESQYRWLYDPKRVIQQQALQAQFGPTQYAQQLAALKQLDPTGYALRSQLGAKIAGNLTTGQVDPQQAAAYRMLGSRVTGELARGTTRSPEELRQDEQALRAAQSARGNILGNAPASAEALYLGQRGQQLYQQRLGNVQNYLGLQSPLEKSYAQAGSFLSLPTPIQQIAGIQGVTPDRASAYVNPNAGYQGAQFGLQNYQNQLAQYSAGGGAINPWASALTGAASGAASGAMLGSVYPGIGTAAGAIGGGLVGGLGGYFGYSDSRLKTNINYTGRISPMGIPEAEFSYKSDPRRFRGALAEDVLKIKPEAVGIQNGFYYVDYGLIDVPFELIGKGDI